MTQTSSLLASARWSAVGVGIAAAAYGAYVATTWYRFGHAPLPRPQSPDSLLDRFMPAYDVVERHHVRVAAPAPLTFAAAGEVDLLGSPLVRAIIRAREVILGAAPDTRPRLRGLLAEVRSLGWGVLAEVPEREIVFGAITKPWEADVTFRALPSDQFSTFSEPGYVKIAWTLRADSIGTSESMFRTETRAMATDATARARFRRYWSLFSPGIIVIRWAILGPLKREAQRRAREDKSSDSARLPEPRG